MLVSQNSESLQVEFNDAMGHFVAMHNCRMRFHVDSLASANMSNSADGEADGSAARANLFHAGDSGAAAANEEGAPAPVADQDGDEDGARADADPRADSVELYVDAAFGAPFGSFGDAAERDQGEGDEGEGDEEDVPAEGGSDEDF